LEVVIVLQTSFSVSPRTVQMKIRDSFASSLAVSPRVGHGSIFADPIQSNPKIAVIKANS